MRVVAITQSAGALIAQTGCQRIREADREVQLAVRDDDQSAHQTSNHDFSEEAIVLVVVLLAEPLVLHLIDSRSFGEEEGDTSMLGTQQRLELEKAFQ